MLVDKFEILYISLNVLYLFGFLNFAGVSKTLSQHGCEVNLIFICEI